MFKRGFVKLVAGVLLLVAGMGDVWGQGVTVSPVSPAFRKWQKAQEFRARKKALSQTNATEKARTSAKARTLSATSDEAEEAGFGLIPETFDTSYLANLNFVGDRGGQDELPARYDLREKGFLTSVRDQGRYGTCWAHAACASLESSLLVEGKGAFDFSENNMANLHGFDGGFDGGGNGAMASAYLLRWAGPVLETDDSYPNPNGSVSMPPVRHVQNVRWIPQRSDYLDNDEIKSAIIKYGALHANYFHTNIYLNAKTASYYYWHLPANSTRKTNHAVALVGWDDNYSAANFAKRPPANGAFIVRNSWGKDRPYLDEGYFYVSYYDESFAWNTLYSFSNTEETDNYDAIYQYDDLGNVSVAGFSYDDTKTEKFRYNETAWGANVFTVESATQVSAVGFYALLPNVAYEVLCYTNCVVGKPTSGGLAVKRTFTPDSAGYCTVPLNASVPVKKGSRFSVVLKFRGTESIASIPVEGVAYSKDWTPYSTAASPSGESFISHDGKSWQDVQWVRSEKFYATDVCIKAYAKDVVSKPTLSTIKISGVSSLASGKSAQFKCTANYSNGSQKEVKPTWSLSSGRNYASISSTGLLTAKSVTETQKATVKAAYTEDGVTKTNTWNVWVTAGVPFAPTGVTATRGALDSVVRVTWTASSGATKYSVYRGTTSNSANAKHLGYVTDTKWNDTESVPGKDYYYFVKAGNASGMCEEYSSPALGWRRLAAPDGVNATDDLLDKVAVTWDKVAGASYYRVYRADDVDGEKTAISGWQTGLSFDDTTAVAGELYAYYVVAAVNSSGYRPSDYGVFDDGMRATPVTLERLDIVGAASIASGASATYTAVAVYSDGTTKSVSPRWGFASGSAFASVSGGKVTAKVVTENATVTLKASCTVNDESATGEKDIKILAKRPGAPAGLSVASATTAGVSLAWTAASGAASYKVYRSESGGTAEAIGTTTETTYVDVSATPGVAYAYSVSAVNGAGESAKTAAVSATVPLAAPTGVSATQTRTDGIRVSWDAVNGATHYRVARSTSASGTKTLLGSWQTQTAELDLTAVAGTKYWYFVMAATSDAGANASAYSAGVQGLRKVAVTLSSVAVSGADALAAGASALYTCTATFSDGTTKDVAPTWSVSPATAAAVDKDGNVTAASVSSDVTATVSASYTSGGVTKTAAKQVKIVAPAQATAEVSDVRVATRWPFANLVDVDYVLETSPAGTKAKVSLAAFDVDHRKAVAVKTVTGDGANGGEVEAGKRRLTWNVGADHPGFHARALDVTVEATVANKSPVWTIENGVLKSVDLNGATDVEIPEGVTEIGEYAFNHQYDLKSVKIPSSVTNIGFMAFYACGGLETLTIPSSVKTIEGEAFSGSGLKDVVIPSGVEVIDNGLFSNCGSLTNVTVSSGVKLVQSFAFMGCSSLTEITIPASVTNVADCAFYECASLTNVTILGTLSSYKQIDLYYGTPSSLTTYVTTKWTGPTDTWCDRAIVMEPEWTIENGVLKSVKLNGATSVTIPDGVTSIGTNVFYSCTNLVSVVIPNSVKTIGDKAFYGCRGLTSVTIPSSVKTIGDDAFYGCRGLTSVHISDLAAWCRMSFADWGGANPLYHAHNLYLNGKLVTSLTLPSGMTSIGSCVFEGCTSLTSVVIPSGVKTIGSYAFDGCSGLTSVTMPDGMKSIGYSAFSGCSGLKSVPIPSSVTSIGYYAFQRCRGLTSVTIPSGVTSIGTCTFYGCTNLTSVSIPNGVKNIGYMAFWECKSLTQITIPSSVTSIGGVAFYGCSSLMAVHISDLAAWCRISFGGERSNPLEYAHDLYLNGKLVTSVYLPDDMTSIRSCTFYGCTNLTSVTMPSSVTNIESDAFRGCSGLTSVMMPSGVTSIGSGTFSGCRGLMSVTMPSSVTSIGSFAFFGCSGLTSVTLPSSVTRIENSVFYGCGGLTSVTILGTLTSYTQSDLYGGTPTNLTTYVTSKWTGPTDTWCGRSVKVMNAPTWTIENGVLTAVDLNGATSVEIPDGVTSIGDYAFQSCYGLTSVVIPDGVKSIGTGAFRSCNRLMSVTMPLSVTSIGVRAFEGCIRLTSVVIPSSVTSVSAHAFSNCYGLTSMVIPDGVTSIGNYAFYGCVGLTSVVIPSSVTSIGNYAFEDCDGLTSVTIKGALTSYTTQSSLYSGTPTNLTTYVTSKWTGPTDTWCGRPVVVLDE